MTEYSENRTERERLNMARHSVHTAIVCMGTQNVTGMGANNSSRDARAGGAPPARAARPLAATAAGGAHGEAAARLKTAATGPAEEDRYSAPPARCGGKWAG